MATGQAFPKPARCVGLLCALTFVFAWLSVALADSPAFIAVGNFSTAAPGGSLPEGWKPLRFKNIDRYTVYSLVSDEGGNETVVYALSESGASGLTKEVSINPKKYPILSWRWKVSNVLRKGDVSKKEGDDYPARLYITFEFDGSRLGLLEKAKYEVVKLLYGRYPPLGALNYIWANSAPVGSMVPNPYTEQVMMFVIQSGPELANTWIEEQRNIYEDYKLAFGQEPPMISGVAIMTDTDNTRETASAFFGDIVFRQSYFSLN